MFTQLQGTIELSYSSFIIVKSCCRTAMIILMAYLQLFMIALGKIFDFLFNLLDISNMNVAPFQLWNLIKSIIEMVKDANYENDK